MSDDNCPEIFEIDPLLKVQINSTGLIRVSKRSDVRERICEISLTGLAGHEVFRRPKV